MHYNTISTHTTDRGLFQWYYMCMYVIPQLLAAEYIFICIEEYYMWE